MRYRARLLSAAGALALSSWACLAGEAVLPAAGHLAATTAASTQAAVTTGASTTGASTGPAGLVLRPIVTSRPASAARPPTQAQCVRAYAAPCYRPAQLQTAYHERPLFARGITGRGQTIVIVDSFGSPTAEKDLTKFDKIFKLPAPPSFQVIQPAGAVRPFEKDSVEMAGWAFETDLDIEYSHTIAPKAALSDNRFNAAKRKPAYCSTVWKPRSKSVWSAVGLPVLRRSPDGIRAGTRANSSMLQLALRWFFSARNSAPAKANAIASATHLSCRH